MKSKEYIKPCPFCGSEIEKCKGIDGLTFFGCGSCGALVSFRSDDTQILEAENPTQLWNHRRGSKNEL